MLSFRLNQEEASSHQNQLMTSSTQRPREEEPTPVPRPSPSPHPQNIQVTDLAAKKTFQQVKVNIFLSPLSKLNYHNSSLKPPGGLFP